jgi:ketosteroid isomerase-like protein
MLLAESNISIVRKYFQAYTDKDRAAIEGLVDEALRFTSPRDNRIDRATYFRRCWKNSEGIVGRKMIQILADGERVFVIYELAWTTGRASRNTELFTLRNGKIVGVEVYFGWPIPHEAPEGGFVETARA